MATAVQLASAGPPQPPPPSSPMSTVGPSLLRVVTPQQLTEFERQRDTAATAKADEVAMDALAGHIRTEWEIMRNHRDSAVGWNDRLLHAQRVFNGKYDSEQIAAIRQFGGSDAYSRL